MRESDERSLPQERAAATTRRVLRVQDGGRKLHTDSFLVFVSPQTEPGPTRVGVTASRKLGPPCSATA